jgi:hypothetical protein
MQPILEKFEGNFVYGLQIRKGEGDNFFEWPKSSAERIPNGLVYAGDDREDLWFHCPLQSIQSGT